MTSPPTGIFPPIPIGQSQANSPDDHRRRSQRRVPIRRDGQPKRVPLTITSDLPRFSRFPNGSRVLRDKRRGRFGERTLGIFFKIRIRFYTSIARSGESVPCRAASLAVSVGPIFCDVSVAAGTGAALARKVRSAGDRENGRVLSARLASSRALWTDSRRSEAC